MNEIELRLKILEVKKDKDNYIKSIGDVFTENSFKSSHMNYTLEQEQAMDKPYRDRIDEFEKVISIMEHDLDISTN